MNNQQWRLPNIEELKSLLWGELAEGERSGRVYENPAMKTALHEVFGEDYYGCFWSSSAHDYYSDGAWEVRFNCFDRGFVDYIYTGYSRKVRLVRGTTSSGSWQEGDEPEKRYSLIGDVVTDYKTGLKWKREPEGSYTWDEAMALFTKEDTMTNKIQLRLEIRDGKKLVVDQDGRELQGVVSIDARSSVEDFDQLTVCFLEGDSNGNYFNCRSVDAKLVE